MCPAKDTSSSRHRPPGLWHTPHQCVLRIDKGRFASGFLGFGDDVENQGGFSEDSGPNLGDPSFGMPPYPAGDIRVMEPVEMAPR